MTKKVLGLVGRSGNGKTSLLEDLLPRLIKKGLRVNVIKHSHHDITLEPAHKDSARARAAGASEVLVVSPYRISLVQELRGEPEPSLNQQLARLSVADLTIVEGYKFEPIPKIEVYRPSAGKEPLYPQDTGILAVVTDEVSFTPTRDITRLDLNQPEQILNWVLDFVKASG